MNISSTSQLSPAEIARLAKQIWEDEGRPEGKAEEHWHRAEAQLHQQEIERAAAATAVPVIPAPVGLS